MTQLMLLKFHFHLDFSGIVWGLANLVQGAIGVITGFISGIVALTTRKDKSQIQMQRSLSWVYAAIIPSVAATIGFGFLYVFEHDRSIKQILDGLALFAPVAGAVSMFVFAPLRNKNYQHKKAKPGLRR